MARKRKVSRAIWIIFAIIALAGLVYGTTQIFSMTPFATIGNDNFIKPLWGRLECLPDDTYSGIQNVNVPKAGISIFCGQNEFTDECKVYLKSQTPGFWTSSVTAKWVVCNNDGTSCDAQPTYKRVNEGVQDAELITIPSGKKLWFECEANTLGINTGINVECNTKKTYRPWTLYDFYGGAKRQISATNCQVPASSLSNILKGEEKTTLQMIGGEGLKWINYVHDWVYGPGTNVANHPTYGQVYCTGGKIYSIVKLVFANGQIKPLDPTYSGTASDGTTYNGMGTFLSNVECCPGTYLCGSDFKWTTATQQTCTMDAQCAGGSGTICKSATSTVQWKCVSGKCAETSLSNVECCANTACANGQICDLSSHKCIQQSPTPYCGDGKCSSTETTSSCQVDCGQGAAADYTPLWILLGAVGLSFVLFSTRKQSGIQEGGQL